MESGQLGTNLFEPRRPSSEDARALRYGHDLWPSQITTAAHMAAITELLTDWFSSPMHSQGQPTGLLIPIWSRSESGRIDARVCMVLEMTKFGQQVSRKNWGWRATVPSEGRVPFSAESKQVPCPPERVSFHTEMLMNFLEQAVFGRAFVGRDCSGIVTALPQSPHLALRSLNACALAIRIARPFGAVPKLEGGPTRW